MINLQEIEVWNVHEGKVKALKINGQILDVKESYHDSESPLVIAERFFETFDFRSTQEVKKSESLPLKYNVPVKKVTICKDEICTTIEKLDGVCIIKEYLEKMYEIIRSDTFKRNDIIRILKSCMKDKAESSINTYATKYIKYLKIHDKVEILPKSAYKFKLVKSKIDYDYLNEIRKQESNIRQNIM